MLRVKQGLHADPVPGQEEPPCALFPYGEGVNAIELFQHFPAPSGVALEQDLRIRVALKSVAQLQQLPAQLFRVIQLSIIRYIFLEKMQILNLIILGDSLITQ